MTVSPEHCGIDLHVDERKLCVRVSITEELVLEGINETLISALLSERGVENSARLQERVKSLVAEIQADQTPRDLIVAEAEPAQDGEDGRIEWEDGFDPSQSAVTGEGDESSESVDFYNATRYIQVATDQHIATIIDPTEGADGRDVCGGVIKAIPGKRCSIKPGENLNVCQGGKVYALIDGVLTVDGANLRVISVFEVRGCVDFTTGNIDFQGSVNIKEGVRDRFVVKATENITVDGLIEAATIVAGGDVVFHRGMAAKERGQLLVDGCAQVGFLNNVRGRIKKNLVVRKELINCDLVIGGELDCEHGSIIGGRNVVTGSLKVGTLGSDGLAPTTLVLGSVPLLSSRLRRLNVLIKTLTGQLEQMQVQYDALAQAGDKLDHAEKEKLTEMSFELSDVRHKLDAAEMRRAEILHSVRSERTVNVLVNKTIFPKVCLQIGERVMQFKSEVKGPVRIGWNEHQRLQYRKLDGPIRPLTAVAREIEKAA